MRCSAAARALAILTMVQLSPALAETVQTASDVFDGRPFLWVEGESATILGTEGATWKVVNKGGPEVSFVSAGTPVPVMPTTTNASGGSAIWAAVNDFSAAHSAVAQYELKFITPGTYQFFLRQSLYDSNNNGNFLNEDSIYLPPGFNKNSGTDWIGFEGLSFDENDLNVDIPTPGFSLDPDGWKPQTGDHDRDGLLELANWGIKSEGVWTQHDANGTLSANGNFNWYNRPAYQGTTQPGNTFDGFFGMKNEFTVTEEMVGQTVTFDLGLREVNVAIDGFLFIQVENPYPDMDLLDIYSQEEVDAAVLPQPAEGDYNGNGIVDAADYTVWQDTFGQTLPAGSGADGDASGTVDAGDYTVWKTNFGQAGGAALTAGALAVPEPASLLLFMVGIIAILGKSGRRNC